MSQNQRRTQRSKRARDIAQIIPVDAIRRERGNQRAIWLSAGAPIPQGVCKSRKDRYVSKDDAVKVLAMVQRQRAAARDTLVEKRVYRCEPGCLGWHLTKLEEWTPRV